uniref:von Willebrand factor A domain-containing protein 7-like isoform X1 n=1 Tax=Petromyzon marinus TaxID=7757 RepID=A0AAJ7WV79_PETMA|nr:von Willebrand factor A domain-containing protein 7-like isoform X1 [Petromyzon marinus]
MGPRALAALLLVVAVPWTGAFFPNAASLGGVRADFTDESITEQGVLRAVAFFLERKDNLASGSLETLKPLTPTRLFQEYNKGDKSPASFLDAIQDIIRGNNLIETLYPNNTFLNVHCEAFQGARKELNKFRNQMLKYVESSKKIKSHLRDARKYLGMALHVLQQFYSNTDWIELGHTEPCHAFGHPTQELKTAAIQQATCNDCFKNKMDRDVYDCPWNVLPNAPLTSGYKHGNECQRKPNGKCSHGGKDDIWQSVSPRGGINKETLDPQLSPHHYLHGRAGEMAVQATRDFLVAPNWGILSTLGFEKFKEVFNLPGYSLAFVLDITGSMEEDIENVHKQMEIIADSLQNSPDAPESYILVPFGDPDVGPVFKLESMQDIMQEVQNLKIGGGGDCPEMALSGMMRALEFCSPRSRLYLITDAGAKDESERDKVEDEIAKKEAKVNIINTGEYCEDDDRRKRSLRQKRSAAKNVFEILAEFSGGSYILTTKEKLPGVLGSMMLDLNAAPVTLLRVSSAPPGDVRFSVEPTLAEFAVSVRAPVDFDVELYRPSGERDESVELLVDTGSFRVLRVATPQSGEWRARILGPAAPYRVEVTGKSMFDFSYDILQQKNGYMLPVEGQLVTGVSYLLWVKPLGLEAGYRMTNVQMQNADGVTIVELQAQDEESNGEFGVPLNFSDSTPFMVAVCGLSPGNVTFCRLQTKLKRIESFELILANPDDVMILPGNASPLLVVLKNNGAAATFLVSASDEQGWLQTLHPVVVKLEPGKNQTMAMNVSVPADARFLASTVYVTAISKSGGGSSTTLAISVAVIVKEKTVSSLHICQSPFIFAICC